jgi:hypothetical protein
MIDVDVFPSDTSWLSEPTTGVHQFGGGSEQQDDRQNLVEDKNACETYQRDRQYTSDHIDRSGAGSAGA